jgi:hypothetical protein
LVRGIVTREQKTITTEWLLRHARFVSTERPELERELVALARFLHLDERRKTPKRICDFDIDQPAMQKPDR